MAAAEISEIVSLKLVVNEERNRVLYAEVGKDFVDILFHLLTFPLATITTLLRKPSDIITDPITVGCLNSLHQSVENLDEEFMLSSTCKEMLLRPRNPLELYCRNLKLNIDDAEHLNYFTCENLVSCGYNLLSTSNDVRCRCGSFLARPVPLHTDILSKGFVEDGDQTYFVTDDLFVMPKTMYTTGFIRLMNYEDKDFNSVNEVTVNVTKIKVLDLLKASFLTKSSLTHIFLLDKTPSPDRSKFSPSSLNSTSCVDIKIKLVIRKSDGKIMYAEGNEKFADFLFSILTLPLGAVLGILGGDGSLGSVDRLYKSVVHLDENNHLTLDGMKRMLAPKINFRNRLPYCIHDTPQFICSRLSGCREGADCDQLFLSCGYQFEYDIAGLDSKSMILVDPMKSCGVSHYDGHVKSPAVFMATDDLVVTPMSPISVMSLLNRLKTSPNDLKEKVVTIGFKEAIGILNAALTSSSALTFGLWRLLN